jgi:acyl-CoA synthetase (AMP-forming)/AMP-acid ligase II
MLRELSCGAILKGKMEMIFRSHSPDVTIPDIPLGEFVLERMDFMARKTALIESTNGGTTSYEQLALAIRLVAANLAHRGFRKGDILAIYCPNIPQYAIVFYAVALLGGTITTISSLYTVREIGYQLRDSGAKYLVTVQPLIDRATEAVRQSAVQEMFVIGQASGPTSFDALLEGGRTLPTTEINPREDVVALPYSIGTAGFPKGVMLTHYNLVANMCQVAAGDFIQEQDVVIGFLPFSHIYGLHAIMNFGLWRGATILTMSKFDLRQFLRIVEHYDVTFAPVIPSLVLSLAKSGVAQKLDSSRLKTIICSGASLSEELARAFSKTVGCVVRQGYGMTETTVTFLSPAAPDKIKLGSAGVCLPNMEYKIADPVSGAEFAANQTGEVCIRGPQVMKGYLDQPEITAQAIDDEGWFHTGDVGYVDDEGYLYIVDRIKELIKCNAFQVSPAELESVLLSHPAVVDAVVIPSPDEKSGEVPIAMVVLNQKVAPEEIMDFVAMQVAPYKKIRRLEIVEQIPKSAEGKILRSFLIMREKEKVNSSVNNS